MALFQKGTISRTCLNVFVVCSIGYGVIGAYAGLTAATNVRDSVNSVVFTGGALNVGGVDDIPGYVSDGLSAGQKGQRTMLGGGQAGNNAYDGGTDKVPELSLKDRELLAKAKAAEKKKAEANK